MNNYRETVCEIIQNGEYDKEKILAAFDLSYAAHEGQKRASGEDYIIHPIEVAKILVKTGLDTDSVVAALLHDTIEDTTVSFDDLKKQFGLEVAEIVDGVTKLSRTVYTDKEKQQVENLRKMFLATAKDVRVIIIKLADRLHNMRTNEYVNPEKQRRKAKETLEIYAPLAHRLGMQRMKIELEDLSIKYLDPVAYHEIEENMEKKAHTHENFLANTIEHIKEHFNELGYEIPHINSRVKHIYSVYRKMYAQNKTIDEIYDLYAIRIIVDNMNECYNALGIIHDMYKPIPGRFKDYISTPKPNMYQSLHTTVIGKEGQPFEVQIRTWDMHRTAEYGIAAHWKYKSKVQGKAQDDRQLEWVRNLLKTQAESVDSDEDFMKSFKVDFFSDEVFVFTPKGDIINLPAGATVIDFAYSIHSAVGNKMIGAKCNGKMTQLDYQPKNGDIIEIMTTNSGKGPGRDWLNIAKTSSAKSKIRQWFKKERREENIAKGDEELDIALAEAGVDITKEQRDKFIASVANKYGFSNAEDLIAAIGYDGLPMNKLISRFKNEFIKENKASNEEITASIAKQGTKKTTHSKSPVVVEGVDNCLVKFARCCNPLPGEHIIGYITKGYGISVHRADCAHVKASLEKGDENDRWLNVSWANTSENESFLASLEIYCSKKYGVLADITAILANMRVTIKSLIARETDNTAIVVLSCDVHSREHLDTIIRKIGELKEVSSIRRGNKS
ncbi:MAG: bifunctional (p)ppGpp synthetase/guanosine-3',5'-bis(diphosphate) 3'-pyrophosphohydrolase [Clostridia bacterium]|nr:bifunctional (p)ppGpp synthetase/guanosine-3',5'-bis(diphosphate) 3'-pyrophosphohydrolase [Clostridia bacterium]